MAGLSVLAAFGSGGTTQGTPVVLDTEAGEQWRRLQEGPLNSRAGPAAILALAGEYRVSFDFLETEVYGEYRSPSTPFARGPRKKSMWSRIR